MGRRRYDPLEDDLRWFFQESEGALGMRSSFGAFVDIAMSGIQGGGRTNGAEARAVAIADARRGNDSVAGAHRRIRTLLQRLSARGGGHVDVLWAAYGPTDWAALADAAHGRGAGVMLERVLAGVVGVALMRAEQRCGDRHGAALVAMVRGAALGASTDPERAEKAVSLLAQVRAARAEADGLVAAALAALRELAPAPVPRDPPERSRRLRPCVVAVEPLLGPEA